MKLDHSQKIAHIQNILTKEFLPHIGPDKTKKAYYLGYMVRKLLLTFMGRIDTDDRDNYQNKRVDTPGMLLIYTISSKFYKTHQRHEK